MRRIVMTPRGAIEYELSRTRRKSLEIRVPDPDTVRMFAPLRAGLDACDAFIRERAEWIFEAQARLRQREAQTPPRPPLENGATILYRGQATPLRVLPAPRQRVVIMEHAVCVFAPDPSDPDAIREQLRKFLIEHARAVLERRVAHFAPRVGCAPKRIAIREQKTRWGSCSAQGNLNFNWKLILAPPEALDYVVVHELCHLRELNHSPAFWAHVQATMPDYKAWRAWLKTNGKLLTL